MVALIRFVLKAFERQQGPGGLMRRLPARVVVAGGRLLQQPGRAGAGAPPMRNVGVIRGKRLNPQLGQAFRSCP